jgi:LysR family transcriptional regulator, regulator for bpeEF and oprC
MRVVESNGFARAADSLNLPNASVTTIIKDLESALKVHLLHRTTRRLHLTPEGSFYFERCARILADIDEMESKLSGRGHGPQGKLRVDLHHAIGKHVLVPALENFCSQYPAIDLTVGFGDKYVDLVRDGIDCAIRIGPLPDSDLVARRIASLPMTTVASPSYLEQHGRPADILDLNEHVCVRNQIAGSVPKSEMTFMAEGKEVHVNLLPGLVVGDLEAQLACAMQGLGMIQIPAFMAAPYLRSRRLVEVLIDFPPPATVVSAVYPRHRYLSAIVRIFVEWAAQRFEQSSILTDAANLRTPKHTPDDLRVAA